MKNLIKIFSVLIISLSLRVAAQDVVQKDTISGTEVTMTMDKNINQLLLNTEENCVRIADAASRNNRNEDNRKSGSTTPAKINVPSKSMSTADICRQNPRILGYKIQLTVVKSNEEAQQVKAYFRSRFPSIKAETDASLRPNYKILAGSYFTKASASSDLAKIRQYFKSAIAVQYRVFCVEAK